MTIDTKSEKGNLWMETRQVKKNELFLIFVALNSSLFPYTFSILFKFLFFDWKLFFFSFKTEYKKWIWIKNYELWDAEELARLKTIINTFDLVVPNPWYVMSINNLLNLKKWNLASGLNWNWEEKEFRLLK